MISFGMFREAIATLKENDIKGDQLMDLVAEGGICIWNIESNQMIVEFLKAFFDGDPDEWIEWWCWECDYGQKDHCNYYEKDSDEPIKLNDIQFFYNFLREFYKK